MKVKIKAFDIGMEVKNNGIEFEVRNPSGKTHLGDLVLTKTKLEWCNGGIHKGNGVSVKWEEFIDYMMSKDQKSG